VSRGRETVSLRPPPADPEALRDFPRKTLTPADDLYRVARQGRSPWWFGSAGLGRFDLPPPDGTCYLAADEVGALLEVVGPGRDGGAVTAEFFAARRRWRLRVPAERSLGELTARRARGFGITVEIGTLVPYDLPRAWAARLHAAACQGLAYWLRHDPARGEGIALFGPEGAGEGWPDGEKASISSELLDRLHAECGLEVVEVPRAGALRILKDG
jgi:RES domain